MLAFARPFVSDIELKVLQSIYVVDVQHPEWLTMWIKRSAEVGQRAPVDLD